MRIKDLKSKFPNATKKGVDSCFEKVNKSHGVTRRAFNKHLEDIVKSEPSPPKKTPPKRAPRKKKVPPPKASPKKSSTERAQDNEDEEWLQKLYKDFPKAPYYKPYKQTYMLLSQEYFVQPHLDKPKNFNYGLTNVIKTGKTADYYDHNIIPLNALGTRYYKDEFGTMSEEGFKVVNRSKFSKGEIEILIYKVSVDDIFLARRFNTNKYKGGLYVTLIYKKLKNFEGWVDKDTEYVNYEDPFLPKHRWDEFKTYYSTMDFLNPKLGEKMGVVEYFNKYYPTTRKPSPPPKTDWGGMPRRSWEDYFKGFGFVPSTKVDTSPLRTKYGITTKKEYQKWLLKGHPDKGGDPEIAKYVINMAKAKGW